jgi:hypothetical protein
LWAATAERWFDFDGPEKGVAGGFTTGDDDEPAIARYGDGDSSMEVGSSIIAFSL